MGTMGTGTVFPAVTMMVMKVEVLVALVAQVALPLAVWVLALLGWG